MCRSSWTWWRTTRPVCGSWFWRRTTSVQSCSSRSVTCCLKERRTRTERLRPTSQAPPPAGPCCQSETSTSHSETSTNQSETSTSPLPGSHTAVRADPPHRLFPLPVPVYPVYPPYWSPKTGRQVQTAQNQSRTRTLPSGPGAGPTGPSTNPVHLAHTVVQTHMNWL